METQLLRHDLACAAQARQCVAEDLRRSRLSADSVDDVLLVISELVTNAILHTGTSVPLHDAAPVHPAGDVTGTHELPLAVGTDELGLGWEVGDRDVTVFVADADPTPPVPRAAADADLTGRGLTIVTALASAWGVTAGDPGKQVWATIPVRRS